MIPKSCVVGLLINILSLTLYASNGNLEIGARSAAVSNASLTYKDVWSLWQNQAGISNIKEISTGVFYENRFLLPELAIKAFGIVVPIKKLGVFGLSYSGFGNSLYCEQKLGLCFAKSYGDIFSLAMQMDYLNTFIGDGYGSHGILMAEAGFQIQVLPELILGAHLYNPTNSKQSKTFDERIPSILKIGLGYTFSDKVICSIETVKTINQLANFRAGVEYHAVKQLYLRCGISSAPTTNAFGFGLILKTFKLDFSETIFQQLGGSPAISMSYIFK